MCGRYVRRGTKQQIAERMRAGVIEPGLADILDNYNVAPTTSQPVVRNSRDGAEREPLLGRWGLVPFCVSDALAEPQRPRLKRYYNE